MDTMRANAWSQSEMRQLRNYYRQGLSRIEIARRLGRTVGAIKTRLGRLGLTQHRGWTEKQRQFVVANRNKLTAKQIAAAIGRSESGVHQLCLRLGLATPRKQRGPEFQEFIRQQHALGWSDAEIAEGWNEAHPDDHVSREWICEVRRDKLGLPHNAYSQHRRQRVAEKTREQCRAAGVRSLAEVRAMAFKEFARKQGWPADIRPRAVQILKFLYEKGPHTRRQIAEAIGMPWKGSRKSLVSNDPEGSYLAHLIARGLVVQLGRLVKGKGRGRSVHLYAIAPDIQRGRAS